MVRPLPRATDKNTEGRQRRGPATVVQGQRVVTHTERDIQVGHAGMCRTGTARNGMPSGILARAPREAEW
jgi:hypothetical protein